MSLDLTKQISLGPCSLSFNSVDLGHTDENGLKLTRKMTVVQAKVGKYGASISNRLYNGEEVTIEGVLAQTDFTILAAAFAGVTTVTGSGKTKLTFGKIAGTVFTGAALKIQSLISANDPLYQINIPRAHPEGDFEAVYSGGVFQGWKVKFVGMVNEAGGTDGNYLWSFGDPTASADLVAPTVSSIVPGDNTTVAAPSVITATISKALDGNTVNAYSVLLYKAPASTGTTGLKVSGTIVLTNNGASTTIAFTPGSALASATTYEFVLSDSIKDTAGNALAFYVSNFTTS